MLYVRIQRDVAEQLGQAAGRHAAREIHLEVAVLRVGKASRQCHVGAALASNRYRADRIALDCDRRGGASRYATAIERRQAAAHSDVEHAADEQHEDKQAKQHAAEKSHLDRVHRGAW
jgi:hypothetical protein